MISLCHLECPEYKLRLTLQIKKGSDCIRLISHKCTQKRNLLRPLKNKKEFRKKATRFGKKTDKLPLTKNRHT
jgi:hypothetical protein